MPHVGVVLRCIISSPDVQSLYELRSSLVERRDAIPGWFDFNTSPCNWTGISCEGSAVHEVFLSCSVLPLSLPFPIRIGDLKNLSDNMLTGTLPLAISGLKMIQRLVLITTFLEAYRLALVFWASL